MIHDSLGNDLERTPEGWYIFPRDIEERRRLYPQEVMNHPAKMHLEIVKRISQLYSKEGDTIVDPFGGTGTTAWAARIGRKVILCELEPTYIELQRQLNERWQSEEPPERLKTLPLITLTGDCRQSLKSLQDNTVQLVITSPPYPHLSLQADEGIIAERVGSGLDVKTYLGSAMNFSRITNEFLFNRNMVQVYQQILRILRPGGFYVSVTKDSMKAGKRQFLSMDIMSIMKREGFEYTGDWFKWKTPLALGNTLNKSKGRAIVEDEDIVVYQKPLT